MAPKTILSICSRRAWLHEDNSNDNLSVTVNDFALNRIPYAEPT